MKDAAKKLFFAYGGDHGLMHHDGVFSEYQQFHVEKEEEKKWAIEIAGNLFNSFEAKQLVDANFRKLISLARIFELSPTIRSVVDVILEKQDQFDVFTKVLACESLLEAIRRSPILSAKDFLAAVYVDLRKVISELSSSPYSVASYYYQHGLMLPDALSEDAIKARISSLIEDIEQMNPQANP